MLESAKDQVLGVDTSGQQVSPHVRYRTACLLIRDAMRSVPCSDEWEINVITHLGSHGAKGVMVPRTTSGNLSIAMVPHSTSAKSSIRPIINLCNDM
jgi:hypothetical protein